MLQRKKILNEENIVLVGGGHGTAALVGPLLDICQNITAVVAVSDGGGDSQELRLDRGVEALGDLRRALREMTRDPFWREVLDYRFEAKGDSILNDRSLGNLILLAAREKATHLGEAIERVAKSVGARGTLLPVTIDNVTLCAHMDDESIIVGEGEIDTRSKRDPRRIVDVFLKPNGCLYDQVREKILKADKIVFCPGSLFTSLAACLVTCGFKEAISKSQAKLIYVMNIMTNHNETYQYKASDHARVVCRYIGRTLDYVLCNNGDISVANHLRYLREGSEPVDIDLAELEKYAHEVVCHDFINRKRSHLRHSAKLAEVIAGL